MKINEKLIRNSIEKSDQYKSLLNCDTIQIGERFIDVKEEDLLSILTEMAIDKIKEVHKQEENGVTIKENDNPDFDEDMKMLDEFEKNKKP